MRFIETKGPFAQACSVVTLSTLLAACSTPMPPDPAVVRAPAPLTLPPQPVQPAPVVPPVVAAPAAPPLAAPPQARPAARNWDEYRVRAAQSIAMVNAPLMFKGPVPDRLASIPVMQVHLNRDGSIRQVEVLRTPKFSPETVQMATQAIRRVGNFGPVGHLPQPWRFTETFLYNDDLKFQLHTLVQAQD